MKTRSLIVTALMLLLALVWFESSALTGQKAQNKQKEDDPTFAQEFWNYLKKADYKLWAPMPGQDGNMYKGTPPHGAYLKVYANRKSFKNIDDPPHGSIIVKENYSEDKKLMAVTVMYRTKGYDPKHKDWWWVKYRPNGKVFAKGDMRVVGKVKSCIDCHIEAKGDDYLFTNNAS